MNEFVCWVHKLDFDENEFVLSNPKIKVLEIIREVAVCFWDYPGRVRIHFGKKNLVK